MANMNETLSNSPDETLAISPVRFIEQALSADQNVIRVEISRSWNVVCVLKDTSAEARVRIYEKEQEIMDALPSETFHFRTTAAEE